jgi:KTSC domain-containing protein
MNEQQIHELKDSLRQIMQMIVERGEPLSDDIRYALAQVIQHVANRIQELRQEEEQGTAGLPPTKPDVEPAPFASSNINAFKYDPKSGNLQVKFQDKYPGQNGPVYAYSGVPKFIFDVFSRGAVGPKTSGQNAWHRWRKGVTPSLGAAMNALIKDGGYPYQRIS